MNPVADDLDNLRLLRCLPNPLLDGMAAEVGQYKVQAEGTLDTVDLLHWWKSRRATLPSWSKAFLMVCTLSSSSAAAERVFSLLKASFTAQQSNTLEDHVETAIMLQFNKRCV